MLPTLDDRVSTPNGKGRVVGFSRSGVTGGPLVRVAMDDGFRTALYPSSVQRICEDCDKPLPPPEECDGRVLTFCAACLPVSEDRS